MSVPYVQSPTGHIPTYLPSQSYLTFQYFYAPQPVPVARERYTYEKIMGRRSALCSSNTCDAPSTPISDYPVQPRYAATPPTTSNGRYACTPARQHRSKNNQHYQNEDTSRSGYNRRPSAQRSYRSEPVSHKIEFRNHQYGHTGRTKHTSASMNGRRAGAKPSRSSGPDRELVKCHSGWEEFRDNDSVVPDDSISNVSSQDTSSSAGRSRKHRGYSRLGRGPARERHRRSRRDSLLEEDLSDSGEERTYVPERGYYTVPRSPRRIRRYADGSEYR